MAEVSEKKRLTTFLLCFFLGSLGIHRFYVGKVRSGIAQILTLGGLGVWTLIDLVMILCGVFKDKKGNAITQWIGSNKSAISTDIPVENKPSEEKLPLSPNQAILLERSRLIIMISALVGVGVLIAVLVLQIIEFQHYRQAPSVWPTAFQSK